MPLAGIRSSLKVGHFAELAELRSFPLKPVAGLQLQLQIHPHPFPLVIQPPAQCPLRSVETKRFWMGAGGIDSRDEGLPVQVVHGRPRIDPGNEAAQLTLLPLLLFALLERLHRSGQSAGTSGLRHLLQRVQV